MTGVGYGITSLGYRFKHAMWQATVALMAADKTPPYVCIGSPSTLAALEIVSIGSTSIGQVPANISTNREREETLTCDVNISVTSGGMDDQEDTLCQRAWYLLGLIEQYVRVTDTTLGQVVRECFLTNVLEDGQPTGSEGTANGRVVILAATFTAKGRVSTNA